MRVQWLIPRRCRYQPSWLTWPYYCNNVTVFRTCWEHRIDRWRWTWKLNDRWTIRLDLTQMVRPHLMVDPDFDPPTFVTWAIGDPGSDPAFAIDWQRPYPVREDEPETG